MIPTPSGDRRHAISLQNPGPPVPDGEGGYENTWTDLAPAHVYARIEPATARDLERTAAGTLIATATHLVTLPYHPQVTTQTRVLFGPRTFEVAGLVNREERNIELVLLCTEHVP